MAQEHKLFSSAGLVFCQIDLGTTPNIAPPSSLKKPVWIGWSFIYVIHHFLKKLTIDNGRLTMIHSVELLSTALCQLSTQVQFNLLGSALFLHNSHRTKLLNALIDPIADGYLF